MLENWTTKITRGTPIFVQDDYILTIICLDGDRGVWQAQTPITPGEPLQFTGKWNSGFVRVIWLDENENGINSDLPEKPQILKPPENAVFVRVNCVRPPNGTATFEHIDLIPPEPEPEPDPFLPVPPPDTAQKHHVTGWKWGQNIALLIHDDPGAETITGTPPTYIDENEEIIPYEVRGWQHGRHLDLEIGNMHFTDEEE